MSTASLPVGAVAGRDGGPRGVVVQQPTQTPASAQPLLQPNTSRAAGRHSVGGLAGRKAGAYGGSEVGSMVGHMVGPPVIGGIVGNLVGESLGESAARELGLDKTAARFHSEVSRVVGRDRADKMGDIALTAMGYSEAERCLCCPCLPASQVLLWIMSGFFVFNCFRLGVGIDYEAECSHNASSLVFIEKEFDDNQTTQDFIRLIKNDTEKALYLVSYPCQFGFDYLVSGAAVWIAFLPFYIFTLFGNCWRQCCCCLCDPVVCFATAVDFVKRCCCECGKFSCTDLVWYSMCLFQVIWALLGLSWLLSAMSDHTEALGAYDPDYLLTPTVISSVALDLMLAGSELVHKARLCFVAHRQRKSEDEDVEMQPASQGAVDYSNVAENK